MANNLSEENDKKRASASSESKKNQEDDTSKEHTIRLPQSTQKDNELVEVPANLFLDVIRQSVQAIAEENTRYFQLESRRNLRKNMTIAVLAGISTALIVAFIVVNFKQNIYSVVQMSGKNGKTLSPYHQFQVKNTISKHYGEMKKCYVAYTKGKPTVSEGRLKIDFEIDSDGQVEKADILRDPFKNDNFNECMLTSVRKIIFPKPNMPAPVYAEHTFVFSDSKSEKKKKPMIEIENFKNQKK